VQPTSVPQASVVIMGGCPACRVSFNNYEFIDQFYYYNLNDNTFIFIDTGWNNARRVYLHGHMLLRHFLPVIFYIAIYNFGKKKYKLIIFNYRIGLLCLFSMRKKRCTNCGASF